MVDRIVFAISLVVLVVGAASGSWTDAAGDAVLAAQLEHTAASPLYYLLASVAAYLPVGEPAFRLALLSALLGAFVVLGVIRAARALLPNDPVAGVAGAVLLVLAPPFRDAAGFANPTVLAACGTVWSIAFVLQHAREPAPRSALAALACAAIVVGSAPWLGAPLLILVVVALARAGAARHLLAAAVAAIGMVAIVLWIGAVGRMPDPASQLAAFVTLSGRGSAAVLVGVGLLGIAFAVVTKLAHVTWLALAVVLGLLHAIFVAADPTIVLALFAVGAAVVPSAVVRMLPERRHAVAVLASAPLLGAALLVGASFGVDDPADAPARLATDLLDDQPPGPGVFFATRPTTWSAVEYAQQIGGARPDLPLAPPLPAEHAQVIAENTMIARRIAASDVLAFGLLDPARAYPRGRSFQLLPAPPEKLGRIRPPARYRSAIGAGEAARLALSLAQLEAGNGRLDAAAHAAGLASTRFGAADLALLATSKPVRPPLFGEVPPLGTPPGPWMLELFGDDLAWVVGMDAPLVDVPPERKLHGLWRQIVLGQRTPDDPEIAALGDAAVAATRALMSPAKE